MSEYNIKKLKKQIIYRCLYTGTKETDLEKFIYTVISDSLSNIGHWIYDITSNESSYLGNFNPEGGVSISRDQSWSPDRTKVVFNELLVGFNVAVPGYMRVYDTIADSINTLGNILNLEDSESYYAASPVIWLEDSLTGDVNSDGIVNVLDIVQTVNLVLTNEYEENGDLNGDGIVNVLDIVQLVNIILN